MLWISASISSHSRSTSWAVRSSGSRHRRCGNKPSGWCDWRAAGSHARAPRSIDRPRRTFSPRRVDRLRRHWDQPAVLARRRAGLPAGSAARLGAGSGLGITAGSDRAAGSLERRAGSAGLALGVDGFGAAGRGRSSGCCAGSSWLAAGERGVLRRLDARARGSSRLARGLLAPRSPGCRGSGLLPGLAPLPRPAGPALRTTA